jgi:putative transposase
MERVDPAGMSGCCKSTRRLTTTSLVALGRRCWRGIKEIGQTRVRYGYRRVHVLLRREGWRINHKKTPSERADRGRHVRALRAGDRSALQLSWRGHRPGSGQVCARIGYPATIRVDQGTEFVSRDLDL